MARRSNVVILLRAGAAVVAVGAVTCFAVLLAASSNRSAAAVAPWALVLLAGLGVALAVYALSVLVARGAGETSIDSQRTAARVQSQIVELSAKITELQQTCDRFVVGAPTTTTIAEPNPMSLSPSDLEPIYQALREIRELTLLTDSERRERLDQFRRNRLAELVKQAFDLVGARQWHQAERLVMSMETEFPNNDEVAKARNYLDHARKLNEEETVARTISETQELMAASAWDVAYARARTLVDGFPANSDARGLLLRVQRERDGFNESTVLRMFDELRHDIDRRMWRRALMHAQHLLERFPHHARAEGVRRQLKTLQDNAEIEERQELEVSIQELIRAQRFEEAIALGEHVLRHYPMSPQAESLETILPRLRELASETPAPEQASGAFSGLTRPAAPEAGRPTA